MPVANKKIYFCHGLPGSVSDMELLSRANPDLTMTAIDFLVTPLDNPDAVMAALLDGEANIEPGSLKLVGFSLGSMAALRIAAMMPDLVGRLTLISPAAPLQMGNFLPSMDGRHVFSLAARYPKSFAALTGLQAILARYAPDVLTKLMFAGACPSDRAILTDPDLRSVLRAGLADALHINRKSYMAYIKDYVTDWGDVLTRISSPVDLWHGNADTWAPVQMSYALQERLGKSCVLHEIERGGHYSTLLQAKL